MFGWRKFLWEEHVKEILGNLECLVNDLGNGATDVECKVKTSSLNGLINDCYNEMCIVMM